MANNQPKSPAQRILGIVIAVLAGIAAYFLTKKLMGR